MLPTPTPMPSLMVSTINQVNIKPSNVEQKQNDGEGTSGGRGTHISDVLDEEKLKIFSYLTMEERQKIRAVCSSWAALIDNNYGMKARIKNSTSDLVRTCYWAVDVELASMTIPFEIENIAFAQTLDSLTFSNILVTYNLTTFLKACCNISQLTFTNIVLDIAVNDPWNPHTDELIELNNLKSLEIKCWTFIDGVLEVMRFLSSKVSYGNLREITVNSQNPPNLPLQSLFSEVLDEETMHPLLLLVKKNERSLRKFTIGRQNFPIVLEFHPYGSFQLQDIGVDGEFPFQLSSLEIHPYFREEWVPILALQNHMVSLNVGSCNVSRWEDVRDTITRNASSLEKFSIGGLSFGQIWDCNVFEPCSVLKSLALEISHSHKVNLNSLPVQLMDLHVFGPLAKHEIVSIPNRLSNLRTVKFSHLGRIAAFHEAQEEKITLPVFKALMQLPKLTVLSFIVCSTVSMDWGHIVGWCRNVDTPGITYEEHFYQLHGEQFRNGITVKVTDEFVREGFDWDKADTEVAIVDSRSPSTHSLALSTSFP